MPTSLRSVSKSARNWSSCSLTSSVVPDAVMNAAPRIEFRRAVDSAISRLAPKKLKRQMVREGNEKLKTKRRARTSVEHNNRPEDAFANIRLNGFRPQRIAALDGTHWHSMATFPTVLIPDLQAQKRFRPARETGRYSLDRHGPRGRCPWPGTTRSDRTGFRLPTVASSGQRRQSTNARVRSKTSFRLSTSFLPP